MKPPVSNIPILLLAAGQSARMQGVDKLMQMVSGKPLIRRQVDMALSVTTGPVIVALPVAPHPRHDALHGSGAHLLDVPEASEGMNASLRTALGAVPKGATAAMVLLGDMPDLTRDDLMTVLAAFDPTGDILIWRGATEDGKPGHPVIFSARLFDNIARLSGDSGGREVVTAAKGRLRLIPLPGQHARLDLDTPQDWAKWRADRAAND